MNQIKNIFFVNKLRGGFYTPKKICDFITKFILKDPKIF